MLRPATWPEIARFAPLARADRLVITAPTADDWRVDGDGRGFVGLKTSERSVTLKIIFVFAEWRRLGAGTAMMQEVIEAARGRPIDLCADPHLHGFYRRFGFFPVRPAKPGGKAWIMRRTDGDA